MCPGRDNAVWQVPVDEEAAAAVEAAEAAAVGGAVAPGEPEAAAVAGAAAPGEPAAADAAAAAAMQENMGRARMRSAAALLLAEVRGLSLLIASTEDSCDMLDTAIELLHDAARELNLPLYGAGRILPFHLEGAGVLQCPIPGSIDAARMIVGRLCGILPPDWYLQIYECVYPLSPLETLYIEACVVLLECFEILDFTAQSQTWQRWTGRMNYAYQQPRSVEESLRGAHNHAKIAHAYLLNLVESWHADADARIDPLVALSSAEDSLDAAADLMDQAIAAMRRTRDALELQAYELMILARNPEDEA